MTKPMPTHIHDSEGTRRGEPEVRYAFIGAGFGLLLIYLGTRIPFTVIRWPIVGLGILFVGVMTAYTLALARKNIAMRIRPLVSSARGHIRNDAQLGTLTRDVTTRCWMAGVTMGNRRVDLAIGGDDDPDAALLAQARDFAADLGDFERRLQDYLAREAKQWAAESPDLAAEINELRVTGIMLRSSERPGRIVLEFDGPDEMRYWYCDYVDGEMSGLDFDT
jgi:hypothetical protein